MQDVLVDEKGACCRTARDSDAPWAVSPKPGTGLPGELLGAADHCYQTVLEYAQSRIQFDRPIAGFQLQQRKLAHMVTELTKGQLLALQLGRLKDQGSFTPAQVSMAKMNNVKIAMDIAHCARTMLGARHYGRVPDHATRQQPGVGLYL